MLKSRILSKQLILSCNVRLCTRREYAESSNTAPGELHSYTDTLYKQNYNKYPTQSKLAVAHDHVFHGDERLPTLHERLKDFKDPSDELRTNIGKKNDNNSNSSIKSLRIEMRTKFEQNKANKDLEIASKELKLRIPIEEIDKKSKQIGSFDNVLKIADHYNINKDLFENCYFKPTLDLRVEYANQKSVYYGNRLEAKHTLKKPNINWSDLALDIKNTRIQSDSIYHSLMFVNLDGNFAQSQNDVLLWFLGNVENGNVNSGREYVDYLQPFPMRGSGWHRCVFVLFEHRKPIDFHIENVHRHQSLPSSSDNSVPKFSARDFKASVFYSTHRNDLVPVGLRFFQTEWDLSVKDVFHNYLQMREPVFEFEFEKRFVPKFEKHPKDNQPFNWYLQEYMDKKTINEQVLKAYMRELSPFGAYPQQAKYKFLGMNLRRTNPRWLKYEQESLVQRKHQYKQIPYKHAAPYDQQKLNEFIVNLPYKQTQKPES